MQKFLHHFGALYPFSIAGAIGEFSHSEERNDSKFQTLLEFSILELELLETQVCKETNHCLVG